MESRSDAAPSNPAARLLELIHEANLRATPQDMAIRAVWARALDAEDNDPLLLRRLGIVNGLPLSIREQVEKLPNENPLLLLKQMHKIEAALQRNIYEPWSNFKQQIDESAMDGLERISFLLSREKIEPVVQPDELANLRERVVEFYEVVESVGGLDPELRRFLLRQLERMRVAIDEVRLLGASALAEAAEAVVGGIVVLDIENAPKSDVEKTLLQSLGNIAATALTVVNLFTAPFNLAITAQKALGPGESQPAATIVIDVNEVNDDIVVDLDEVDDDEASG